MKHNVLVFPCGSEIGLEVHRSVRYSRHFELYGGSSVRDHGEFVYSRYVGGLPGVHDPAWAHRLNEVIAARKIDFLLPAHDDVVLRGAREAAAGALACPVVAPPAPTCEITRSKRATYRCLQDAVPTPRVHEDPTALCAADFPLFLKPDVGQGSKGTALVGDPQQLQCHLAQDPTLLVLEHLPGREYTVDCFTDRHGQLRYARGRERLRVVNGISAASSHVDDPRFGDLAAAIQEALPLRGVWFFQVKERLDGELVLLEVGARVAGTMGLARASGVNLVLLSLFDRLGQDVCVLEQDYDVVVDRSLGSSFRHDLSYRHVYLDLDDLVLVEGKVVPAALAFVYQCINKGVRVHLVTRHRGDLDATLARHRLRGVFDDVIRVDGDDPKSRHITERDAIFLDDSFAERAAVAADCRIPVFDGHAIEALLEAGLGGAA